MSDKNILHDYQAGCGFDWEISYSDGPRVILTEVIYFEEPCEPPVAECQLNRKQKAVRFIKGVMAITIGQILTALVVITISLAVLALICYSFYIAPEETASYILVGLLIGMAGGKTR